MAESLLSLPQKRKHEETIATTKVYVGNLDSRVREYVYLQIHLLCETFFFLLRIT